MKIPEEYKNKKIRATVSDAFNSYDNKYEITKSNYTKIVSTFCLLLVNSILKTGTAYKLPSGIGIFGIEKKLYTGKKYVDWHNSRLENKLVFRKITHTSNWSAKWFWDKRRSVGTSITFNGVWRMRTCKMLKRALAYELMNNNTIIKYYCND